MYKFIDFDLSLWLTGSRATETQLKTLTVILTFAIEERLGNDVLNISALFLPHFQGHVMKARAVWHRAKNSPLAKLY